MAFALSKNHLLIIDVSYILKIQFQVDIFPVGILFYSIAFEIQIQNNFKWRRPNKRGIMMDSQDNTDKQGVQTIFCDNVDWH